MRVSILAKRCALLAAVLSPASAWADGQHEPAPAPVSIKDLPDLPLPPLWAGAYIGAHFGRAWDDSKVVDYGPPVSDGAFACEPAVVPYCGKIFHYGADGWISGIQLGYNFQYDWLVFGVEGDLGRIDADNTKIRDRLVDRDIAGVDYGWYGTLTGRLGVATPRALFYVKGGAIFAERSDFASDEDEAFFTGSGFWYLDPLSTVREHGTDVGWTLGGGIEYALTPAFSIKAEYMFADFGREILRDVDGDGYQFRNEIQSVKFGVNYHLGAGAAEAAAIGWGYEADPYMWAGPYLGVFAAFARDQSTSVDYGVPVVNGAFACEPAGYCGDPFDYDGSGWAGGTQIGFNFPVRGLIVGIEGDAAHIDMNDEECKERSITDSDVAGIRYGWYGAVTGRIGVPLYRSLIYAKGGVAFAEIKNFAADIDKLDNGIFFIDDTSVTNSKHTDTGWTVGGGIEYALRGNLRLKAEYMYADFGKNISSDVDGDLYQHDNELHLIKVGVNYYVNRPAPELPPLK
ncbi:MULTISPECIES: outer membrane beta-barrel protein [Rhodomicrobium]|uniref:outer membrane protein n=1 Tax=Rhodomicrobium TaxID=1068 RepID=UPI000B4B36D7|nr:MULTISPECIES: outer membrane beta-barrel protein [Rhodomicrobium]